MNPTNTPTCYIRTADGREYHIEASIDNIISRISRMNVSPTIPCGPCDVFTEAYDGCRVVLNARHIVAVREGRR